MQLTVVMPSKGNKVIKNKFVREAPAAEVKLGEYFESAVRPTLGVDAYGLSLVGDVQRVCVVIRGSTDEIEVDSMDDVVLYTEMALVKVVFYVEQVNSIPAATRQGVHLNEILVRQPALSLPEWMHAGRPAMTHLFSSLKSMMEKDKVGFKGSVDLKLGCEWMLNIASVLYKLSPFHLKFKNRGYPIPKKFGFSDGADDFKKKGRAPPLLTQSFLEQVCKCRE